MKTNLSKTEAKEKIEKFFRNSDFAPEQLKKIKRLAMKFNIKLGAYRKMFCKKCLSPLAGELSINKTHKTIKCKFCGFKNRIRISWQRL
jgi:RNase P subunit RPR2